MNDEIVAFCFQLADRFTLFFFAKEHEIACREGLKKAWSVEIAIGNEQNDANAIALHNINRFLNTINHI